AELAPPPQRVKFFALHRSPSCSTASTAPRELFAARHATAPALQVAAPVRDAAETGSSRSGIPKYAPLPRSSVLPIRTTPLLRETLAAVPAPPSALAPFFPAAPPSAPV